MKTKTLTGAALDWAVAMIEFPAPDYEDADRLVYVRGDDEFHFSPSTDWAQSGPIIEREGISLDKVSETTWIAFRREGPAFSEESGPTPLVAAMRCYVASQLGDEVDVPEVCLNDK